MTSSRDLDRELTLLRQRIDTIEEVLKGIRNEVTLATVRDRHENGLDAVYLGRALRNIKNELGKLSRG